MGVLARTREMIGESKTRSGSTLNVPDGARILIVCDDHSETERLKTILQKAGIVSECAKSITAGCEAAKSGRFQVVVSTPLLSDGSWRRFTDIANHCDLGLEVVLWARNFDLAEWGEALKQGAFDVLDALNYLEVWNRAQFLKNLKRSLLTAQDEKMLNKLSSGPRFPRTIRRNKEDGHVHGTEMRLRIHRRVRPDSRGQASQALTRPRTLGTRQNTPIQFLHPQRGQKTVSQSVFARVTAFVGQGRKHP